jgi:acetyl-CoA carboxylase carboxyl transferase subunit alpha
VLAAERFNRPVISLIDMPGADASVRSEQHGQSQAIAEMIDTMGRLTVPNIAVLLGEGHSGGALAFANANRIIMLEHAIFSVASPEAVAAIVTTDGDMSASLPMTAPVLQKLGLVDQIIPEDRQLIDHVRLALKTMLATFDSQSGEQLVAQREQKFLQFLAQWDNM